MPCPRYAADYRGVPSTEGRERDEEVRRWTQSEIQQSHRRGGSGKAAIAVLQFKYPGTEIEHPRIKRCLRRSI